MANNNNIFGLKNLPKNLVAREEVPTANLLDIEPFDVAIKAAELLIEKLDKIKPQDVVIEDN